MNQPVSLIIENHFKIEIKLITLTLSHVWGVRK